MWAGASKTWYGVPAASKQRVEAMCAQLFPGQAQRCAAFMRHKQFLVSPTVAKEYGESPAVSRRHGRARQTCVPMWRVARGGMGQGARCWLLFAPRAALLPCASGPCWSAVVRG